MAEEKNGGVWPPVKPFVNGGASGMLFTCVIQLTNMINGLSAGLLRQAIYTTARLGSFKHWIIFEPIEIIHIGVAFIMFSNEIGLLGLYHENSQSGRIIQILHWVPRLLRQNRPNVMMTWIFLNQIQNIEKNIGL